MRRRRKERGPAWIADRLLVAVEIATTDRVLWTPEIELVFGIPARDGCIGRRKIDHRRDVRGVRRVKASSVDDRPRDAVPDHGRRRQPEPPVLGLLSGPPPPGFRSELLHFVIIA